MPGERVRGHRHNNVHLMFLLCGSLAEREGSREVVLERAAARLSSPAAVHNIDFGDEGGECLVAHFTEASDVTRSAFLSGAVAAQFVGELHAAFASPASAPFALLTIQRAKAHLERPHARAPDWLVQAWSRLMSERSCTVESIARDLKVSREHLSRAITEHYGTSPAQVKRLARAAWAANQHGAGSAASGADIAHEAGFADQSHMIRDFRRIYGTTPEHFRAHSHHENPSRGI
jgi:AraC-like DNA-binding protein